MATVDKNFRIKNGLVVEGSTATVNGSNVLTENSTEFIQDAAASLLTNGSHTNITVTYNDSTNSIDLTGAVTYTDEQAQDAVGNSLGTGLSYDDATGAISINRTTVDGWYDASGAASTAQSNAETFATNAINALDTDDIEEGASNLYFTNQRALDATSAAYDASGAASTAEGNANTYTDNAINALDTDDIEEGASNKYFTDERAQDAVGNNVGSGLSYDDATGAISVDTSVIANKTYVDTAVSNLVDSAPALLDTLNELAAAIGDDENFVTTVTTSIGEKVAKAGDTMTGALTLHADPSSNMHAATKQYVDSSQSAAQSAAESTAQSALDDVLDGTTNFTALDVSTVSRQIAATTGNIVTAAATTALSWTKTDYRSAKMIIKAKNGSHTHVSEVIVTLDTSDNISVNEYGITTTNGSLMDITADISGSDVRIRVTPVHNNTEVMAHATLLV